jgi:adenine-specific DNA methylase
MQRTPPRLLIEEWLPAAAIGVECIRERSTGQQPPDKRLHVWWARRPLAVSRAAVLASVLPADFPRDIFERLMGFWGSSRDVVQAQDLLNWAKANNAKVPNPHGERAFRQFLQPKDLKRAHDAALVLWEEQPSVLDPMAGGGSIPLESARLGFSTMANEYNPVACSILEATVDYPFRYGKELAITARKWGAELRKRFNARLERFYPKTGVLPPHCYIFARTVPCPDTQHPTPLVPDWHLLKPKGERGHVVAEPIVNKARWTWTIRIREIGKGAGQLRQPPRPTYADGKGISLFKDRQIPADYIKAKAQQGEMKTALYAVAIKTSRGLKFQPPESADVQALEAAEKELARLRPGLERNNIIPTELYPEVSSDERPRLYGMPRWADMFSPRQLLCFGVLVEELRKLRSEIVKADGTDVAAAVEHLLAFAIDKLTNYNSVLGSWHAPHSVMRGVFDRHDFSFKPTFAEMASCNAGGGLDWAIDNVLDAYETISRLPRHESSRPVEISISSATSLPELADGSMTAVVVDPPYADNVQYAELADFFYVWLKRTQGHRHPEWFSTYLCERDQEVVVNISRHRERGQKPSRRGKRDGKTAEAKAKAHAFYQGLMTDTFKECRRLLRDDGSLTVMFTHKKQEAWEALFESLIRAGFTITATWPVKTESEHSLHQAKKNAAQSTVILVARKRPRGAGVGYFDTTMRQEIAARAHATAERLQREGLNPVDQLVGSFGPAMEVYSQYDEVRTDTGVPVRVDKAIEVASDAVSTWRIRRLAARGLAGVEPEGQFALLCWDVLGAAEFRFNEAKLLGHAAGGMDVDQLVGAGLVSKSGDKIKMLSAKERRRERALEPDEVTETLFGTVRIAKRHPKKNILKVHPNDPHFRTALDACHALALRFLEAGSSASGVGSARALARQQRWTSESGVARLMQALVLAAPEAVRHEKGKKAAAALFPEFRAWHALLQPLFGIEPPDWTEKAPPQGVLPLREAGPEEGDLEEESEETESEEEEEGE